MTCINSIYFFCFQHTTLCTDVRRGNFFVRHSFSVLTSVTLYTESDTLGGDTHQTSRLLRLYTGSGTVGKGVF